MTFTTEQIAQIGAEHLKVRAKYEDLLLRYVDSQFKSSRANEHAKHGFARRLKILTRCLNNVFEKIPPGRTDHPTFEELTDAVINIQAFQFNIFGATDNLAWICVFEKNLKAKDGSALSPLKVGLSKKHSIVRQSLQPAFQTYLNKFSDWFEHLENYRHALAHRIPLYIPPFTLTPAEATAYQKLETQKRRALLRGHNAEYARLLSRQKKLGTFKPYMTHSYDEKSKVVYFHPQMLNDSYSVIELGQRILIEVDSK